MTKFIIFLFTLIIIKSIINRRLKIFVFDIGGEIWQYQQGERERPERIPEDSTSL